MSQEGLRGKAFSNFLWKFSEQVMAQAVNLIVSIILARLLLPKDYGVVTAVLIFIAICDVFINEGFASALIQKKDADAKDFSSMFFASIVVSLLLYFILFISAPFIASFFGPEYELLSPILRVMGLQIPISAFKSAQQAYVSRNLLFKKFFWATLGGKTVSAVIGIWMAVNGFGAWALAGQSLSGILIDTAILYIIVDWRPIWFFSFERVKPMLSFGSRLVAAGLVDTIYNKLRSFVIGKRYTPSDLAFYEKGDQFPSVILNTIQSSLRTVLYPVMSRFQDDEGSLLSVLRSSIKVSTFVVFPIMIGLAIVAEDFIVLLLTDKWIDSVIYAQIFCGVYVFYPIYSINLQAIKAKGDSKSYLYIEMLKKVTGVICLVVAIPFGVRWIAFSLVVATIINYIINAISSRIVLNYRYRDQILDIIPNAILSFIMGLVLFIIPPIIGKPFISLSIHTAIGVIVYLITAKITKNEGAKLTEEMVRNMIHRRSNGTKAN